MSKSSSNVVDHSPSSITESHIDTVFKLQSAYALKLRTSSIAERKATLKMFLAAIEKYTPQIIEAGKLDFNKPETETMIAEVFPVVQEIKHTLKHLAKWMKPKAVLPTKVTFGTKSKVIYEPKGVSLIISPWNYPVNLTFGPLVSAIAAGCTAMIKPSEFTPNMARVISAIVAECFDEEQVAVFEGEVDVSIALLEKPYDHIFFTGSPQVGKSVMAAAAKNLTSVTLELGGKSPAVIDKTTDMASTAGKITWGKCANNGQTCIAPDYALVHEDVLDDFIEEMKNSLKGAYGDGVKNNDDYGRIVNVAHTKRIKGLVDDAIKNDGKIVYGGDIDVKDRFIAPTLIVGKSGSIKFLKSRIMNEEIFGPVLPIITYKDLEECISHINALPKPLAIYVYSEDRKVIDDLLTRTSSGGSCINTNMVQFLHGNLPFGGVNNSGIGSAHGEYGFKAFSHERAVLEDKFTSNHLLYPPYTNSVKTITRLITRFGA